MRRIEAAVTAAPRFPDNPNHANGTCEDCGDPCHVYGCRWCPVCYDAGSAKVREATRLFRIECIISVA
jgi:hypothetical protein